MLNSEKRAAVYTALTSQNSREWTVGAGANKLTISIENPTIRTIKNGKDVFTVDVIVRNRSGIIVYYDRFNMADPPTAIRSGDQIVTDPIAAMISTLTDATSAVTAGFTKPRIEKVPGGFKGDTLAVRCGTNDGRVASSDAVFATMAAGAALAANTTGTTLFARWRLNAGVYGGDMAFQDYDTSSIGALPNINTAVYTVYSTGTAETDTDGYNLEVRYKDWGGTVTTADWFDPRSGVWSGLPSGGSIDLTGWDQTDGVSHNFSDSGVYSSINKTGTTRIVIGLSGMDNATPTGNNGTIWYSADQAGTSTDPLLTVTYSLPASLAPHNSRPYRIWTRR